MTTTPKNIETAETIIKNLTGYAKDDAKIWVKGTKCRIYFGRQFVEILEDGTVDWDKSDNPYGVLRDIEEIGITLSNKPSYA